MNDNLFELEKLGEAYRQRRLQEAEHSRRLHEIRSQSPDRPAWCPIALTLARALIALGQRLQSLAEPDPQPRCETC
jgi:hypothetical protein